MIDTALAPGNVSKFLIRNYVNSCHIQYTSISMNMSINALLDSVCTTRRTEKKKSTPESTRDTTTHVVWKQFKRCLNFYFREFSNISFNFRPQES